MLKEVFDRLSSPILGPCMATWSFCNWKIWIHVFTSGLTADEKIIRIKEIFNLWEGVYLPIFISIFYIFLLPLLVIQFGKFENLCIRIRKKRDSKEKLKILLIEEIHYECQYKLYLFLLKKLSNSSIIFKNNVDKLNSFYALLNPLAPGILNEIVRDNTKAQEDILNSFMETGDLLNKIIYKSEVDLVRPKAIISQIQTLCDQMKKN